MTEDGVWVWGDTHTNTQRTCYLRRTPQNTYKNTVILGLQVHPYTIISEICPLTPVYNTLRDRLASTSSAARPPDSIAPCAVIIDS